MVSRSASTRPSGLHVGSANPQCRTQTPRNRSFIVLDLRTPASGMRSRLVAIRPAEHIDGAPRQVKSKISDRMRTVRNRTFGDIVTVDRLNLTCRYASKASEMHYRFFPLNGESACISRLRIRVRSVMSCRCAQDSCQEGVPCRFRRRVGSSWSLRLSASMRLSASIRK